MKILFSLTLLSITLATSYSAFSSQTTQTFNNTQTKICPAKYNYENGKLRYIIIKEITNNTTTHYRALDCLTKKSLEYPFNIIQTEGSLCINPTSENQFLADMYEGTSTIAAPASAPATTQSTSSQSSSTATSTQAPVTAAAAQAQSSSTASSLIAKVASLIWKS